jgi:hypothetical protein
LTRAHAVLGIRIEVMEGETTMKIIARVERVESGDYVLRGKVFDSFLAARREMLETIR